MGKRGLPGPDPITLKVRRSCAWIIGFWMLCIRAAIATVSDDEPNKKKYLKRATKVDLTKEKKALELCISEHQSTTEYPWTRIAVMPEEERHRLRTNSPIFIRPAYCS